MSAHPQFLPYIIGCKGTIINAVKEELKVEVTMPKLPEKMAPRKPS